MAVSHIQNIAPGPPSEIAKATPAMFAVPTREAAEIENARNGEMFRLPSESRPPGSVRVRNISGSRRTCTAPVRIVKYRPVGMRTATRMYDDTPLTLSNTLWSNSIELRLLRQSCWRGSEVRNAGTPSVVTPSLPPLLPRLWQWPLPEGRHSLSAESASAQATASADTVRIHVPSTRASSGTCSGRLI